jgi:hypothetical protein
VITVWAGLLVGAQVRYLISSANGWLGGFGCSAAALNLRDRDTWIGWDAETPRAQLRCVVCMSRFLLRPRGCRRLASKVLGRVLRRVADDFERGFGYRPVLVESFVDASAFDGACDRAANFRGWARLSDAVVRIGIINITRALRRLCLPLGGGLSRPAGRGAHSTRFGHRFRADSAGDSSAIRRGQSERSEAGVALLLGGGGATRSICLAGSPVARPLHRFPSPFMQSLPLSIRKQVPLALRPEGGAVIQGRFGEPRFTCDRCEAPSPTLSFL